MVFAYGDDKWWYWDDTNTIYSKASGVKQNGGSWDDRYLIDGYNCKKIVAAVKGDTKWYYYFADGTWYFEGLATRPNLGITECLELLAVAKKNSYYYYYFERNGYPDNIYYTTSEDDRESIHILKINGKEWSNSEGNLLSVTYYTPGAQFYYLFQKADKSMFYWVYNSAGEWSKTDNYDPLG